MLSSTSPSDEQIFREETSIRSSVRLERSSSSWTMTPLSILDMDLRLQSVMRSLKTHSWEKPQGYRSGKPSYLSHQCLRIRDIIVQPRLDHQRLAQPGQLSYKEGVQPESSHGQRSIRACQ